MIPCLISRSLVPMARATSSTTMPMLRGVKSSFGGLPPSPSCQTGRIPWPSPRLRRCGRARSRSSSRRLLESSWLLIPYKRGLESLIAGCLGAESTGAAATDAGLLVCAFQRNTSAPPTRQAPTTHGVQLVSPS